MSDLLPTTHEHLTRDFDRKPRQIAEHLRTSHGVEPKPARKGYEREVWQGQHEDCHVTGISGHRRNLASDHTR